MIITDKNKLKSKCEDISSIEEFKEIKSKLEFELSLSAQLGRPGIGLAAPQIGINKNVVIIRVPSNSGLVSLDLANAVIASAYDYDWFAGEGCLSFPEFTGRTWRAQEVYVKGNRVLPHSFIATGLLAVVIQHELDHLQGINLPDIINKKREIKDDKKL